MSEQPDLKNSRVPCDYIPSEVDWLREHVWGPYCPVPQPLVSGYEGNIHIIINPWWL